LSVDRSAEWREFQQQYWIVKNQDANRFSTSSFLGGFALATFAALAYSQGGIPMPQSLADENLVRLIVACLLIGATLFFLVSAMSSYQSIHLVNRISHESVKKLESAGEGDWETLGRSHSSKDDKATDAERLEEAWRIHEESGGFITPGFVSLLSALVFIGLEINWFVLVIAGVCFIAIIWRLKGSLLRVFGLRRIARPERDSLVKG
jgi:hypothetical protein